MYCSSGLVKDARDSQICLMMMTYGGREITRKEVKNVVERLRASL
jgi:hypothetical protein